MKSIRRIFVISCLVAASALIWAGVYARKQGFTNSWRQAVEEELAEEGYYIDIGKLTLGAFRGLVAEDVLFFRDETKKQQFAEMNDIYLDVDLGRIMQKEITINTLDFKDGQLTVPLETGGSLNVNELSGRVALTESFVEVVRLEGKVAGVEVAMQGSLLRPRGDEAVDEEEESIEDEPNDDRSSGFRYLGAFLKSLSSFEFPEGAPTVKVEFRGDLSNLQQTIATAEFHSPRFRKKGSDYQISSFDFLAEMDGRIRQIKISQFKFEDNHGRFVADGVWNRKSEEIDFELTSNADLVRLMNILFPNRKWGEVVIYHPPKLTAEGTIDLNLLAEDQTGVLFPGQIIGEFSTDGFGSAGEVFKSSKGDFSVKGKSFYVRNVRVDHKTGVAFLNCKFEPDKGRESLQFQTAVKMDPRAFERFFKDEETRRFLRKWKFSAESGVDLAASGQCSSLDLEDLQAKGEIYLRDFQLNGVPFRKLGTDFEIDGAERWYRNVQLMRDDGSIEASLAYTNTDERKWEIKGGVSTVDLTEGFGAFSPMVKEKLELFQFLAPPEVAVQGTIDARNAEQRGNSRSLNNLEISFSTTQAVRVDLFGKNVALDSPEGTIFLKGDQAELTGFRAGLCGGTVELDYETGNFREESSPFTATIRGNEIGLRSLGKIYGFENSAVGYLDGILQFAGTSMDFDKISGTGEVSISDRDLFRLPVLRELKELMPEQEEGSPLVRSTASFEIEKGILTSDEVRLLPDSEDLRGRAEITLPDGYLDAELSPADPLQDQIYKATGSLSRPEWQLVPGQSSTTLSGR